MSPPSSSRKLFKFSTSDFNLAAASPSKVGTPYEFRSRRASETEINTVDIMTTEAMITNRFQTLFSEAKPESIKEFSPTKKNFEKMQTSNIYAKYSNPKMQSSGNMRSSRKQDTRLANLTSIFFNPLDQETEIVPEEDIISFGGGNTQEMSAALPKSWKEGKTMKNSTMSKKEKKKRPSKKLENII